MVVGTMQAGDGHVGQLKFLQFSHVWDTVGGRRGLDEGMRDQMKCVSAFRLKDIWRVITMTTNKVRWGRIHLAKAVEGTITCLSLCAREEEEQREGRREGENKYCSC